MKPNKEELAKTLFHEGLELIKKPKTYDKGVHYLNKANRKGSYLACYVLALEMLKEQKLYPADPERSEKFFKKALPFIEVCQEGEEDYYFTRHCLATYYYHGYGGVAIDEKKCVEIETECAEHGLIVSTKFLIEYYSKDASRDLDKVEYYKALLAKQEAQPEEQIAIESSATDLASPKEEKEEVVEEVLVVEQPVVVEEEVVEEVFAEKGEEPSVDAHQFFKFDEQEQTPAEVIGDVDDNWEKAVDTHVEPLYTTLVLTDDQVTLNESKLAKALNIFENDKKDEYDTGFELLKEASEVYPIQANCYLGDLYSEGKHIEKNELTAIHYFQEAERYDSAYAAYKLGLIYLYSSEDNAYADKENGLKYLRQAGLAGLKEALFELGEIYYHGKTGIINKSAAKKFYELALDRGYIQAKAALLKLESN